AGLGCGAAGGEWAVAAKCAEDHVAGFGDWAGVAGWASHGGGGLFDGEVVHGEPALHGHSQRLGFDHRIVSGVGDGAAQIPCAVSAIAVPLPPAGVSSVGGDEL